MNPLITKILWIVIGLNTAALIIASVAFLLSTNGRNVTTMESGWMVILFAAAVVVLLLAALPLYFGHSTFSLVISVIFALLPLVIYLGVLISNHLPKIGREKTMAELYYKDPAQRSIADAIEKGEVSQVKQLIKDQNLNIQGNRVWDWDGLNYLQFAIRVRSKMDFATMADSAFRKNTNDAIIKILVAGGSETTPALPEGIKYLPIGLIDLLLDAGANPNTYGFVSADPLIFEAVGQTKPENDIAIQLIKKGAEVNVKNREGNTLLMFAANNAGTSESWTDTWRVIRYLIEISHADYTVKRHDGISFISIVKGIREKAKEENVTMPEDFNAVLKIVENDPEQKIATN